MDMTDYMENVVGNHLLRNQPFTPPTQMYLAIFTSPTDDLGNGTEASGGGYARQPISLDVFVGGASSNTTAITFSNLAAATYTHGALWDALTGGNMWMHGAAPMAKTIALGGSVTVAIGDLDIVFT